MRFFCMDVHISVIADFKSMKLGVDVYDWCLSGHNWLMNRPRDSPKHIDASTWMSLDQSMIQKFQSEYDSFLRSFDGFIVAHAACFAMIFEKYGKPIIMMNSVRFDIPFNQTKNISMLNEYKLCLHRLKARGLLTIVSNNLADQYYTLKGLNISSQYIPSLCLYTGIRYRPTKGTFLCYTGSLPDHPLVSKRPKQFQWSDIGSYRGIIAFPYEVSIMSYFEHFTGGMPLFFPSIRYMMEHVDIQSTSAYWGDQLPDYLSEFRSKDTWLRLADMYNVFISPNTHYFDSIDELFHKLETFEYVDDSEFRDKHIERVRYQWKGILQDIVSGQFWSKEPRHLSYNRLPLLANVVWDVNYRGEIAPLHSYPYREPYSAGDVIFVKTDLLGPFLEKKTPTVPITLVTGVSDLSPTEDQISRILSNPNIRRWIGTNIPVSHPKIVKILIGVGEAERTNGIHNMIVHLHNERIPWEEKANDICVPYHGNTHASRNILATLPKLEYTEYMREISKHKFVVSMRGNGIDTHRFCEILLMGSVPVVEHSGLDDLYSQFPCVIVNSFNDIDVSSFEWSNTKYERFLDMFWLRNKWTDIL